MKKLALRKESLTELTSTDLRRLAGAEPKNAMATINVSDGSCVCGFDMRACDEINISDGSCVCTINAPKTLLTAIFPTT